ECRANRFEARQSVLVSVGVGPGAVATPINLVTMNDPAKLAQLNAAIPLGRMARPDVIAAVGRVPRWRWRKLSSLRRPSSRMAASCIAARVSNCRTEAGMDKRFDVIIIGSGAGGGTLAGQLAPSGKNILILERGDWLKREAQNWDATAVFVENRYVSPDTWYDRHGRAFQPQVHYFVGGATKYLARRFIACAARISASCVITMASHRLCR